MKEVDETEPAAAEIEKSNVDYQHRCSLVTQSDGSQYCAYPYCRIVKPASNKEAVNSPDHYNSLDASCKKCGSRIECIDVVQHMPFNLGNAVKYIWRAPHKDKREEDLRKAIKYLELELARLNADS